MPIRQSSHMPDAGALPVIDVETVIVGAGFGGLGMGIQLVRQGITSFVVLERSGDVGGTWRDNVYPGVACDIPAHLYSYSFRPKPDWSHYYARGPEILEYLRCCAREEGLTSHLRLGTSATEMRWHDRTQRWHVTTNRGTYRCEILVMAAGRLSEPRIPGIPGLESFQGPVFHTSRWDEQAELAGKRIGVVGTGASAVQMVPHLAAIAESIVLFQRSAPYVVPRADRPYSDEEKRAFARVPELAARLRSQLFWRAEVGFAARAETPEYVQRLRSQALNHLENDVADPTLRAQLTPGYSIGCKRVLLSDDFYLALSRPNVTLEPSPFESVDGTTAVSADGAKHDVDVLVFATGFHSARPPFAENVFGLNGLSLSSRWAEGMVSYASTAVHGFPNMFIINGPNASLGHNSAIAMIEAQITYILQALEYRASAEDGRLHVRPGAEESYVRNLDRLSASTVWTNGGCDSWYLDAGSGRQTLLWPGFAYEFRDNLAEFDRSAYYYSSNPLATR